ncbi:MAG: hypothetical protein ACI4S3_02520 [Candidatus Gastranaerophilaceae bacterium]
MNKKSVYIPNVGIAEVSEYFPTSEEEQKIIEFEQQAEKDIEAKKQTANVHFRWTEFEIKRAKRIAEKLGMPYQTYLKSTLKQAMDKDEKKLM